MLVDCLSCLYSCRHLIHNFILKLRFFPALTRTEILSVLAWENTAIVQSLGAIEQHGYH